MGKKIKDVVKKFFRLVFNPRFLLCFGIAWIVTNGWSYVLFAVGTLCASGWMMAVAGAYMAFLWFPFTPEKLLTLALAILLLRWLFPHDEKTLGVLREMRDRARKKHQARKQCRLPRAPKIKE
ncbi:MAG: hypothetical protein IIX15_00060 [Clostridia bacterium]|nr:hypothetical protein [Clostridia bacterium]